MTSKNYLCKGIRDHIHRHMFLTILVSLALLVALPIHCITELDVAKGMVQIPEDSLNSVQEAFLGCLSSNSWVMVVVAGAAILYGLASFFYLYSGEKTDFYHSLPWKREVLFLVSLVSSLVSFLVPYLIATGITYLIGTFNGGNSTKVLPAMAIAIGVNVLYFLVFYAAAVLAVMLTGNLFTGVLGFAGIMSYGIIIKTAYSSLNSHFFDTLSVYSSGMQENFLSPFLAYRMMIYTGEEKILQYGVLYGAIVLVVLLALDLWLYKIRPSESYHKSIAFPKLEPVIKVVCVIPIALLAALFFSLGMRNHFVWFVAGTIVVALVLSAAFDFLYSLDIKSCIRPKISTGVILAVLALVIMGYRMDITGVDSFLPDKGKVQAMSVKFNSISERMAYPVNSYEKMGAVNNNQMWMKDFDAIYALAQIGVEYYADNKNEEADAFGLDTLVNVDLAYEMKSGKKVYRSYYLPETEEVLANIQKIYDNWEYREKIMPTYYADAEDIEFLYVTDALGRRMQLDVQRNELEILYKTYKNELEGMTFEEAAGERILGYLVAEQMERGNYGNTKQDYMFSWDLPIYEGFSETRAMLTELGNPIEDQIPAEEVLQIRLTTMDEMGNTAQEMILEKPEEIQRVLEHMTYEYCYYGVGSKILYDINVEIIWTDRFKETGQTMYLLDDGSLDDILQKLNID